MNNDLLRGTALMSKGAIVRMASASGLRIECMAGTLWITQDGDTRDVILEAGDAFAFDRRGPALVSALVDSRYLMLGTATAAAFTAPVP